MDTNQENYRRVVELYNRNWSRDRIAESTGLHESTVRRMVTKYRKENGMEAKQRDPVTDEERAIIKDCMEKGMISRDVFNQKLIDRPYKVVADLMNQARIKDRIENGVYYSQKRFMETVENCEKAYIESVSNIKRSFPMPKVSILQEEDIEQVKADRLAKLEKLQPQHDRLHNPTGRRSALFHKIMSGEDVNLDNL